MIFTGIPQEAQRSQKTAKEMTTQLEPQQTHIAMCHLMSFIIQVLLHHRNKEYSEFSFTGVI